MTTYTITRFYQDDDRESETIVRGLTLEQAQAHCQREDTHGEGWFDGYESEDSDDDGKAEYQVRVSNTFEADSPEDAVRQMVEWLIDNGHQTGYKVVAIAEDGSLLDTSFIDAEDVL